MHIFGRFCFLIVFCSVLELYKRILKNFLGLSGNMENDAFNFLKFIPQRNDFGFGFLVFGFCSQVFGILFGLFLVFGLGLKFLQVSRFFCHFKGKKTSDLGNGVSIKYSLVEVCDQKIASCKCNPKENNVEEYEDDGEEDGGEDCNEDEEFNVMALRKMVKIERGRARKVRKELEKERLAAASAAEEAMAMILRLQSERSCVEMEANQYRRMAEQKQVYNEGIIQSLQWIVAKHEEEMSGLEDQLRLCRRKLKIFMKESEMDEWEEDHMIEDYSPLDDMGSVVSSLDFDG